MFWLPMGFDRADGVTPLPSQPAGSRGSREVVGTPIPADALQQYSSNGNILTTEEEPDSPEIERAEQGTFMHRIRCSWAAALFYITGLGRGQFVQDTGGNLWRILSSKIQHLKGDYASVNVTAESLSFDTPPDEFSCVPIELGIDIIKHPRYSWCLLPQGSDYQNTYYLIAGPSGNVPVYLTDIKNALIRAIQNFIDSPVYPNASYFDGLVQGSIFVNLKNGFIPIELPNPNYNYTLPQATPAVYQQGGAAWPTANCQYFIVNVPVSTSPYDPIQIAIAATKEILTKLWRHEDTPYIPCYQVTHSQYFFAPTYLNPGGYIEDPRGWIPDYFLNPNTNQTLVPRGNVNNPFGNLDTDPSKFWVGGSSIFDAMANINPQCYSVTGQFGGGTNISWLRKSDEIDYQRTWFKVTHTWIGSPIGHWDTDLYNQNQRPQIATDFNQLV